ncbi:uroporphyrinogen-III C-methyltransferase [Emticicia sp. CRIBPO]|uniref:uroporphyrinogen-III C-methyltransferase n=1 Tax=Emticicia sp. CRIBPO TaxID=2683258 RepID=UPI001412872F|nr:uroporphyrinogen-III C-methyltransferase [Emticicia sp. CRIBPO]NBA84163.1 uroporphyrinogen-III C-methyltransferase [Emticicia sp. CRIBPO]
MEAFTAKRPRLTVVGAGPGDPELITLKAVNALRKADVVLYDALANPVLLDYCHPFCEKVFVGKIGHQKGITQDDINHLIVEKAHSAGHVVRLKGGDPFIFGRGIEEMEYAAENEIETDYIPGISSVMSGGFSNIPLTDRRFSDGFWVITGHKSDGSLSEDLRIAAQTNATVVVLMGMSKLAVIAEIYKENNKMEIPVAIIQNATTPEEKIGVGTIGNMVKMAAENMLSNPAVIIIGEVVNFHKKHLGRLSKELLEQ